jgi:hypothetical protein
VPWTSLREQAPRFSSIESAAPTTDVAGQGLSSDFDRLIAAALASDRPWNANAQPMQLIMPSSVNPAALALVTTFVGAGAPWRPALSPGAPAIATASASALADDSGDSHQDPQYRDSVQDIYHQPLYRIADRSELGGMSGAPYLPSVALLGGKTSVAIQPGPTRSQEDEEPPPAASHRQQNQAGVVKRMLQIATTWLACHVLHLGLLQRTPRSSPSVLSSRESHPTSVQNPTVAPSKF